jgi:hypothetical protein
MVQVRLVLVIGNMLQEMQEVALTNLKHLEHQVLLQIQQV